MSMLATAWACGFLLCGLLGIEWKDGTFTSWISSSMKEIGDFLEERLSLMEMSRDVKGQILAMTLGRKGYLSPELKTLYRVSGASHLLALSGMHLGILVGILNPYLRKWFLTKYKWWSLAGALIFIWSYALLTGTPKSLMRAAMMLSLFQLTDVKQQSTHFQDIFILCICIIFILDPGALTDVGFQLSCMAILGIGIIGNPLRTIFIRSEDLPNFFRSRIVSGIISATIVSASAQLFTLPITIHYFHSLSPYSTITSLIAIPLTTCIIYSSIALYSGLALMIPLVTVMLKIQNLSMEWISTMPYSFIEGMSFPIWLFPIYYFPLYILHKYLGIIAFNA